MKVKSVRIGNEADLDKLTNDELLTLVRMAKAKRSQRKHKEDQKQQVVTARGRGRPPKYVSWEDAKRVLTERYGGDPKLGAYHASRVWGMLLYFTEEGRIGLVGHCDACGGEIVPGRMDNLHKSGCPSRSYSVKTTLVFMKRSIIARKPTIAKLLADPTVKSALGHRYPRWSLSDLELVLQKA